MFEYPREAVKRYPSPLWFDENTRNVYTGIFEQALMKTAKQLGTPIPSARQARLDIAGEIFEKQVSSFKEFSDAEIWALYQWVSYHKADAYETFKVWLNEKYGSQSNMFEEKPE